MRIKFNIIILFLILFASCEKHDPIGFLNPNASQYGFDITYGTILYNGEYLEINNGEFNIGENIFNIQTEDIELLAGKEYTVILNGDILRLFYTELPIITITTNGEEIVDEPKIPGRYYLLEKGKEPLSGFVGIELRGGYMSQQFRKKSYSIELWKDEQGSETDKISLLGMRVDDDWILDGMWNEPARIRDFTSHQLWLKMGRVQHQQERITLGIDRKYCELFLNGDYLGVYWLGEKIDRKQLNLQTYDNQLEGELYKGYELANGVTFSGLESYNNQSFTWSGYKVKYPKKIEEVDWTNLHGLVDFVVNSSQPEFNNRISSIVDIKNVIDHYIFLNLVFAGDNTGKNIYTARHNSMSLYYLLPWDMDGSFGNNWMGERIDETEKMLTNGLFDKLLAYPDFRIGVKTRWGDLRSFVLSPAYLKKQFRDNFDYLTNNGVYQRELLHPGISPNFDDTEIDFIESWIDRRVIFLDTYFNNLQ